MKELSILKMLHICYRHRQTVALQTLTLVCVSREKKSSEKISFFDRKYFSLKKIENGLTIFASKISNNLENPKHIGIPYRIFENLEKSRKLALFRKMCAHFRKIIEKLSENELFSLSTNMMKFEDFGEIFRDMFIDFHFVIKKK